MNGAEFFMRHLGWRLLPEALHTGDALVDAQALCKVSITLAGNARMRLSSCWIVLTPDWFATSLKLPAAMGARTDVAPDYKGARLAALKTGQPCMLLKLGKRTLSPRDLVTTLDPRAACECTQGGATFFDATKDPAWKTC